MVDAMNTNGVYFFRRITQHQSIHIFSFLANIVIISLSLTRINVPADGMKAVIRLANGDMRKSLNILQCTSMGFDTVDEDSVYTCTGQPLRSDISSIVNWMLNDDFTTAYNSILLAITCGHLTAIPTCVFEIAALFT